MKTTIIIQYAPEYAPNNWHNVHSLSETKDDAIKELKDIQSSNPDIKLRIVERTVTEIESVIYIP